ncbi:MAG: FecR domain-containing protein [Oligoflexia bacterium]|nr:FecR domain-containing protein [Oligoflexia bacterium]
MKTIIMTLLLISNIQAQNIGKVLFSKGEVFFKKSKDSKATSVKKGLSFSDKSIFKTGKGALVVLALNSGSKIKVNQNSQLIVSKEASGLTKGSSFFEILKSKVRKNKKIKYRVKTKHASMGVRGTQFFVSLGNKNDSWMCVNEGLVEVKSKDNKTVLVKEGEGVKVAQTVSDPKPLPWTKRLNWEMVGNEKEIENKVNIEDAYQDLLDQDYD